MREGPVQANLGGGGASPDTFSGEAQLKKTPCRMSQCSLSVLLLYPLFVKSISRANGSSDRVT